MFPSFFDLVAIILKTSAFSIFWQNSFVSLIEYRANNPVPFTSVYFIRHRVNATPQGNTIKRTHNRAKNRAVWRDKRGRSCAEKGGKGAKGSRRMKKQGTKGIPWGVAVYPREGIIPVTKSLRYPRFIKNYFSPFSLSPSTFTPFSLFYRPCSLGWYTLLPTFTLFDSRFLSFRRLSLSLSLSQERKREGVAHSRWVKLHH